MKKKLKYLALLSLLFIITYYIYFNSKGYNCTKDFFIENEKEFNDLSSIIYNQNKIKHIVHKNFDYCFPFTLISDNRNSYFIIAYNGESFGIEVDESSATEEIFWERGFDNILDSYSKKKINLILKELEISESLFLEIIKRMNKVELFAMEMENNSESIKYVKFFTDLNEGLLFDPNNIKDEVQIKTMIQKRINANWFYLYEKNY